MKKYLAAVITAFALVGGPASAQAPAAVDPAAVTAVNEMLVSMKYREVMKASFEQMSKSMPVTMRASISGMINNDPSLSPENRQKALSQIDKIVPAAVAQVNAMLADPTLIDELIAQIVPLYASTFTVNEIHQLAAFYKTPVGQKMLASTPKIMNESVQISQRIVGPRIGKMVQQVMQAAIK